MVLWRTHPWEPRGKGGDSCVETGVAFCEVGRWTQAVSKALPVLLGQIFAYFTISKSGQSYMRVMGDHNESDLAKACSGFLKRACVARSLDNDPPLALVNDLLQTVL